MRDVQPPAIIPSAWRRSALLVTLGCIVLVTLLGLRYHNDMSGGRIDRLVEGRLMTSSEPLREWLGAVSGVGSPAVTLLAVGALLAWTLVDGRRSAGLLAVTAPVLAAVLTEFVLKPWVGRTLDGDLAFPSGHAVRAFALAFVTAVLMVGARRPRARAARLTISLAAIALATTVAVALASLGWHYATDMLGAALLAAALVLGGALVIDSVICPHRIH